MDNCLKVSLYQVLFLPRGMIYSEIFLFKTRVYINVNNITNGYCLFSSWHYRKSFNFSQAVLVPY